MKNLKTIPFLVALLAVMNCSSSNVTTDYDRDANFAQYKTYDWVPNPREENRRSFLDKRVKTGVDRELGAKGFQQTNESPDLLIAYHSGVKDKVDVTRYGYRYGYRGRRWGTAVDVRHYKEGTLILDIIDAKSKDLLWRGAATDVVDRDERAEQIENAIKALIERFPPKD